MISFTEIKRAIQNCPITWLPALLVVLIETLQAKKVFREGGIVNTVKSLVDKKHD